MVAMIELLLGSILTTLFLSWAANQMKVPSVAMSVGNVLDATGTVAVTESVIVLIRCTSFKLVLTDHTSLPCAVIHDGPLATGTVASTFLVATSTWTSVFDDPHETHMVEPTSCIALGPLDKFMLPITDERCGAASTVVASTV